MNVPSVCAVIVTYNRKELLKECIDALIGQKYKLSKIIIINNCSNDGTSEMLEDMKSKYEILYVINMEKNIGGAGGFYEGIKAAYDSKQDYIWLMDDDTIPDEEALQYLVDAGDLDEIKNWGFLCSNVVWKDNTGCLMNIPALDYYWNNFLDKGLIKLKGTSFVSVLFKRDIIKSIGFPIKEFFIWGDDAEYTHRVTKSYEAYLVEDSKVIHKMGQNTGISIFHEDKNRIDRYFYDYRNRLYIAKKRGTKEVLKYFYLFTKNILLLTFTKNNYRFNKIKVIFKGMFNGIFFNPRIEYPEK
ncbi:glycosyltransferase family 2 protein [Clostridium sp. YIM B02515]|uniref:Glycosyltransferase family 2 protein n=1 Tax=Clostridium rhizosphaerae TaxID=2803861 RepID=A0ABS1TDD3_9CLOT|nr:glycosyltransferase family 2 protein [Clostridium rhizosphaerae]MBL4936349.1 glycosyltransferase family 2 protein [Clostridium rhizosphaerae]